MAGAGLLFLGVRLFYAKFKPSPQAKRLDPFLLKPFFGLAWLVF